MEIERTALLLLVLVVMASSGVQVGGRVYAKINIGTVGDDDMSSGSESDFNASVDGYDNIDSDGGNSGNGCDTNIGDNVKVYGTVGDDVNSGAGDDSSYGDSLVGSSTVEYDEINSGAGDDTNIGENSNSNSDSEEDSINCEEGNDFSVGDNFEGSGQGGINDLGISDSS